MIKWAKKRNKFAACPYIVNSVGRMERWWWERQKHIFFKLLSLTVCVYVERLDYLNCIHVNLHKLNRLDVVIAFYEEVHLSGLFNKFFALFIYISVVFSAPFWFWHFRCLLYKCCLSIDPNRIISPYETKIWNTFFVLLGCIRFELIWF